MAARVADVFEIVMLAAGADALLGGGGAAVVAFLAAEEDVLELVHARIGKKEGRVVGRHERGASNHAVFAGGKEVEEFLAYLMTGHHFILTCGAGWEGDRP